MYTFPHTSSLPLSHQKIYEINKPFWLNLWGDPFTKKNDHYCRLNLDAVNHQVDLSPWQRGNEISRSRTTGRSAETRFDDRTKARPRSTEHYDGFGRTFAVAARECVQLNKALLKAWQAAAVTVCVMAAAGVSWMQNLSKMHTF